MRTINTTPRSPRKGAALAALATVCALWVPGGLAAQYTIGTESGDTVQFESAELRRAQLVEFETGLLGRRVVPSHRAGNSTDVLQAGETDEQHDTGADFRNRIGPDEDAALADIDAPAEKSPGITCGDQAYVGF